MTREELIDALDSLCWQARRYGHDDYGLDDFAVDYDGKGIVGNAFGFHPEAVAMADVLILSGVKIDD